MEGAGLKTLPAGKRERKKKECVRFNVPLDTL